MSRAKGPLGPYSLSPESADTVGERVRQLRVDWQWTQTKLATELNISQRTVSHWELGLQEPSGAALGGLVRLTGLSVEAWSTGAGFHVPDSPRVDSTELMAANLEGRAVILPHLEPGQIGVVDLNDEFPQTPVDVQAARALVKSMHLKGRLVWIVVSGQ